jgi:putative transposase
LTGEGGFLPEMIKAVLERGMQAELTDHLGYDKGDPAGRHFGELPQRHDPQDGGHRGRRRRSWISRGTATAASPRRWYPRVPAAWAGLDDMIISCTRAG